MGKRKRGIDNTLPVKTHDGDTAAPYKSPLANGLVHTTTIQIITGSYERVLHGFTATIPDASKAESEVTFADTFLIQGHSSAIRCLALSPSSSTTDSSQPQKIILASGSSDERINLYHLSASPPQRHAPKTYKSSPAAADITENPKNRELGSLLHHSSSISALKFSTRSKLLSAAEDNTIAVTRTRDWAVLSTIKAPIPKALGRPSGDTAPPGGVPSGVNDFAIHPSMKLMVSVGKGEKCMRLWNLVTGKKAGVLNFDKNILQGVGEGRWGSGEGRKVEWDSKGEEFVVGFERGAVTFGMDSKPKSRILPSPQTKIHQLQYITPLSNATVGSDLLAVSTEDGRIIFFLATAVEVPPTDAAEKVNSPPSCLAIAQLGGKAVGVSGRIKEFEVLKPTGTELSAKALIIVAASSDGAIRLWIIDREELSPSSSSQDLSSKTNSNTDGNANTSESAKALGGASKQIGRLIGTYQTGGNRITCMKAFVMASQTTVDDYEGDSGLADGDREGGERAMEGGSESDSDS
ncbi:MAG: hypothetical protein M1812_000521 [Candelaria pacifica]|nr:MAG: hypothetical protein M1812_000521 [Candelaria pacifica]